MNQSQPSEQIATPNPAESVGGGIPQPLPERIIPPLHGKVVLRGAPNHRAKEMQICEPWTFQPATTLPNDKASFGKWLEENTTVHLVYATTQGLCEGIRISKSNPLSNCMA